LEELLFGGCGEADGLAVTHLQIERHGGAGSIDGEGYLSFVASSGSDARDPLVIDFCSKFLRRHASGDGDGTGRSAGLELIGTGSNTSDCGDAGAGSLLGTDLVGCHAVHGQVDG